MALRVAVLATGGTIATRTDGSGTAVARASGRKSLGDLPLPAGVAVDAEDVFRVGSYATTLQHLQHLQQLAVRVAGRLRGDVAGPHRPALLSSDADAVRAASTEYVDPTTRPPDRPPVARARG